MLTWFTLVRARTISARNAAFAAVSGAMLAAGPFLAPIFGVRGIEPGMMLVSMALTPVVVAVARPVFRHTESAEVAGRLWPGIAAVAGLLLVVALPFGMAPAGIACLCAMPVVTGLGSMWFRSIQTPKLLRAVFGLAAATITFGTAAVARHSLHRPQDHGWWLAAAADGAMALLSVLSLLRIGGTRWSAQFVVVPATAIVMSLAMMHVRPDARWLSGIAVLIFSAVFLLLPPASESSELGLTQQR